MKNIFFLLIGTFIAVNPLDLQYAQLKHRSAQLAWQKAKGMGNLLPDEIKSDYYSELSVSQQRIDAALGKSDFFSVWLKRAEINADSAKGSYFNAVQIEKRSPGSYTAIDLERLKLSAIIANLDYEKGKIVANSGITEQYRWQISYLDSQVQQLNDKVFRQGK